MSATTPTVTPLTAPGEPGPARILVVDDHPANVQIVGSVLGRLGYEIMPATDGATALKRVAVAAAGFDSAGFAHARNGWLRSLPAVEGKPRLEGYPGHFSFRGG